MADILMHVVHHIHGQRVRVRLPAKRHDAAYFHQVKHRLETLDSVHQADVNPTTASVLIHYSGDLADVVAEAAEKGLTEFLTIEGIPSPLVEGTIALCDGIGGHVFGLAVMLITFGVVGVYHSSS